MVIRLGDWWPVARVIGRLCACLARVVIDRLSHKKTPAFRRVFLREALNLRLRDLCFQIVFGSEAHDGFGD